MNDYIDELNEAIEDLEDTVSEETTAQHEQLTKQIKNAEMVSEILTMKFEIGKEIIMSRLTLSPLNWPFGFVP